MSAPQVKTSSQSRAGFFGSFTRAQVSAALATGVDFGLLFFLTEVCHVYYVLSVALGALAGAITNFSINRHWSFSASEGLFHRQVTRYTLVSALSLILNSGGVYLVTEMGHIHYAASVFIVSALVGILFNFPLHRYYVFR